MNIYTYCLQDGYIYSNLKKLVRKFMKIYKMPTVRHYSFLLIFFSTIGIPKSTVLVIIFRVFYLAALNKKFRKNSIIHFQSIEMVFKKGTRSSYNETMNNGTSSSSSDYETTPKFKKCFGENINAKST